MPHNKERHNSGDEIENEILKEMRVRPIDLESILEVEPMLSKDDVKDLSGRDQRLVFEVSKLTQQVRALIGICVKTNDEHLMRMESNMIRTGIEMKNVKQAVQDSIVTAAEIVESRRKHASAVKWAAMTGCGAAIVEFVAWVFHKIK